MKAFIFAGAALFLSACSAQPTDTATPSAAPAAVATTGADEKIDPNSVELRIIVPKSSLPVGLSAMANTAQESAKPRLAAADADKLRTLLGTLGLQKTDATTCFRVCEPECHEVGGGTGEVCHMHCHRECF